MPLLIHVRKGKKIFMNGAVLENASERTITFLLKNQAEILRCDDVLVPDDAVTPASRIYYALQCLYLFPDSRGQCLPVLVELVESYRKAAPSASELVERLFTAVRAGQYYDGLKVARELIAHERRCLQRLDRGLAGTAGNEGASLKAPLGPAVARPREAAASKPREAALSKPRKTLAR
jgi:flagellar biosynthesis repressor protein FlbT